MYMNKHIQPATASKEICRNLDPTHQYECTLEKGHEGPCSDARYPEAGTWHGDN